MTSITNEILTSITNEISRYWVWDRTGYYPDQWRCSNRVIMQYLHIYSARHSQKVLKFQTFLPQISHFIAHSESNYNKNAYYASEKMLFPLVCIMRSSTDIACGKFLSKYEDFYKISKGSSLGTQIYSFTWPTLATILEDSAIHWLFTLVYGTFPSVWSHLSRQLTFLQLHTNSPANTSLLMQQTGSSSLQLLTNDYSRCTLPSSKRFATALTSFYSQCWSCEAMKMEWRVHFEPGYIRLITVRYRDYMQWYMQDFRLTCRFCCWVPHKYWPNY